MQLTSITVPSSVTSLGNSCFRCGEQLECLYFEGKLPDNINNSGIPYTCKLYVQKDYLKDYKNVLDSRYNVYEIDDPTNINQAKTRGIVATSDGGIVTLSGLDNGEVVSFYSPDGRQLGAAKAENGIASCAVMESGVVIAKVGKNAIKIAVRK